jgi:hypothetical protein
MKQITSLWLLVLFMASTTLIAQNTSTGLASQKAAAAKFKTEQQQNLNAEIQPGVIPGVNQTGGDDYSKYVIYHGSRAELYDNGPLITAEGVGPGGTDYSELQDASLGMGTYGAGCQVSAGNSIADDFEVTETWNIDSFTFYSYQTGSGTTSTLNDVRVQIYDGNPSAGGVVIWGNLTTNLMTSTSWTNAYRVLESAPDVARPIMAIVAGTSGLTLNPGTYWVEMSLGGTGASGPWAPAVTIVGQTTTGNSIQKTSTGWAPLMDVGPQGLPFVINGTGGQQANKDVGISAIPQPATGVNLTATEAIAITIRNYGLNAQSNIPWTVNWNGPTGAGSANGTFAGPLAPGSTATVNLTQTANLSTHGSYTFTACTALAGDENAANDCKNKTVSNNLPEYCPASTTTQDEYIANVLCGTIDNSSGWQGGVANYTAISTAIAAGQSEAIIVTNGNPWSSDKVTVWVDWNMSYTFDEGDEKFVLVSSGGGLTFTGAIVVPTGTPEGDYRMRVRMSYSTDPTPCGVMSYGEVEDYTIHVGQAAAKDVGVSALNMGGFYQPGVVSPKATVKNFGSATQTFNVTLTIGSYTSTKSVAALVSGATQEVTFDNWNATVGSYTAEACTQLAGDENPANNCKSMGITVAEGNFVFAYNAYDPSGVLAEGPVTFDIVNPGGMSLLAPTSSAEFIAGATWANGTWYGCMYGGGLYTIDTQTGAMVLVGPSADLSGLAFDGTTMYGASVTDLYTVNMATGASTLIGPMGNAQGLMIGIACDAAGNLYGYDIGDDNFYSINKTTGAATIVGPLGYNFNYAQDMAYDKVNNVCYIAGYTTTGALFSVNVATGAATQLGLFPGGAEITGFAIPDEGTTPPVGTPPINFTANYTAGTGVATTWEMPESGQWVRWDNGENWGSLGLEEAGTFWAAARWETSDLAAFDGQYLTQVNLFPVKYNVNPTIKLMIWEGANAANLVYEQVLTGLTWDEFNTVNLTTMHQIDASKELMVGFEITHEVGEYPLGYDEGPAIAGKGDMISLDGIEFVSMSTEYEIDNNFNIGIYVEEETDGIVGTKQIIARNAISNPSATFVTQTQKVGGANLADGNRALEGFNVYRNGVKVNTDPIPAAARAYTDVFSAPGTYTYNAKAIYTAGLSDPSNSVEVIIGGAGGGIVVNPTSFTEFHPVAQITTKTLTVTNTGTTPLTWGVTASTNTKQAGSTVSSDPIEDQRILAERLAAEGLQSASDIEPGVIAGINQNSGNDYTKYATYHGSRAELYDNGPLITAEGVGPGGTDYSELQDASLGMGTYGAGCQISAGNSIADDFEVTETWNIDSFTFYSYQTGSGTTSTLNDVRVQIYDGDPSAGGTVIWGNLTTNLMTSTAWINAYRVLESSPDVARPIMEIVAGTSGLTLSPGTYWVEMMIGGTGTSGPWAPAVTIVGQTTTGNSIQKTSTGWAPLMDVGPQGLPFVINGTGGPQSNKDVGISAIPQPVTGVNLTGAEAIAITIKNFGLNAQSNIPWTVNWNGPTGAGSANGTFAGPLAAGATATVTLTQTANLSTHGDYTFTACTALSGDENTANDCKNKTVSNKLPEYCPASTTTQDEYIANVLCGTINNTSGWQGGVADYTAIFTEINAGESEAITVTNGNAWASDKVTCWVDWDMSYTFDEGAEKFVLTSNGGGATFTGNIAVPAGTPNGEYRMRVRMSYSTDPTPCGVMSYGEVEDYTIHVGGGTTTAWLSVPENTGGTLAPGGSAPVTVTFNSNGLPDGTYNGILDVTSNDPNNPLVVVPATLTKGGSGIVVTPVALEELHDNPPQVTVQDLTIHNLGTTPINYTVVANAPTKQAGSTVSSDPIEDQRILNERLAAEGHSNAVVLSMANTNVATPSPYQTDDDVIRYDNGVNDDAIGLTAGGTFEVAAYWPASSMGQYAGKKLSKVEVYINDVPNPFILKVYGQGSSTVPGALLHQQTVAVTGTSWNVIDLSTQVDITGGDLWVGYSVTHAGGTYPAGCDAGPAVAGKGDMISLDGVSFESMAGLGLNYNWNIASTLIDGGPALTKDVGVSAIVQPTTGVNLTGAEAIVITIKNYGTASQSNIPWTVNWNGPTGAGSANGTFAGPLAGGATANVNLTQTANLSALGSYTFTACTALTGDENAANNCKDKTVSNNLPEYCPASTTYEDEYISNVLCGAINNTSAWQGGVADYTAMFAEISAGASEPITVTNGNPWASDKVTCWVDWDMSYTFDEGAEKFVLTSNGGGANFTGNIAVPAGTPNGDYRMRVRMSYSTDPTPCGVMSYGEVEEYTIKVGGGTTTTAWLSVPENTAGTLAAGQSVTVPVTFNSTDLANGIYNGTIDVTSNDPNNPLVVVPATLEVGEPTLGIHVTPMVLNETHANPPQQTTKNLTFTNTGDTPLDVNLTVDLGGKAPDAFTMNPETYAKILAERQASEGIVPSTGRAPYTEYIPTGGDLPLITLGRDMAFAYNAYDASGALVEGPITFDLASPGSLTQLAPTSSGDFIAGADWADGTWYGCMYGGGLYTIDETSGAMTFVGSSPDLSGLAWDGTTMYGASTTALYTIDLATGAGTMVGPMGNNALMIGIAANADGEIYGYDIGDDNFYHINKTTGAATVVGSLGFDFNYAQDMAFDRDNGICYLAGYTTTGGLYTVNVNTGAATLVGNFAGGAEVTGFAIPYTSGPPLTKDLSLSSIVSPSTGVNLTNSESVVIKIKNNGTAAQSNFPWTVTWNGPTGAGSANGTYSGSLAAGATADITAGTANLSTYGVYTFEACVNLAGDENPANNCKSKNVTNLEPSLCVDGLYSSGCSFGDGLIAWSLANINVPNIPCAGTPPWYHDYRDMVHELVAGETYTLTVQAGYTSTYFDVWIDFNDDLVLTNDELIINDAQCASSNTPYTFDFTVPANAPAGDHVLRFRTNWTAPVTDPCATYSYGNCCDFKANTGEGTTTPWLWVAEGDLSFTLPANGGQKIVPVHFDSEGLSIGTIKNGGINVASNDPNTPLLEVDATLTVGGGGTGLTVNPTALNETHENAPEITTQILNLTNNTGAPVSWTLATFAGAEGGVLNIAPEVSTETPVYTGQVQVESQPGVTPGEIVEGPAYTNFAYYNGNRGELYNNGGFVTAVGVGPGGTDYSELQDASLGMGTYGSGCQVSAGNSIADDFVVTENWTIESFTFYSYQTGSGTTSTINDARVQIYNGNPSAGGTVIWGNLTSNLMTSTSWTNAYRVLESAPATNRPIFKVVASTPGLTLAPGTYWVEMTLGGTGASGPWAPPVTVVGQTTTGNSIQKTSTGWAPLVDVGPQGLPFIITGTTAVAPWLTATPVSGTLANGQSIPITVTYNSEGLSEGVHNGTVTISSNQPDIVVPVTLTVAPPTGIEPGPTNLAYSIVDFFDVNLTWDAPAGGGFNPAWITYSTGAFTNSVGTNGAANFDVAARWTPADLAAYPGGSVTKVDFVPGEPGNISTYTIKIWQGSGNPTLKYSQLVTTVTADVWNTVVLNEAYQIDLTQELWIGFNCNTTAGFPAGCDDGPQVEGKGNMMFWEGAWTTLTQLAPTLTYNWNIKGYLEAGMQVEGYNVYRKGTSGSFALIGSTNATTLTYLDNNLNLGTYYYHVKAQYAAGLSVPSNQVQVDITSISDPSGAASALQIYPNPAKDQFTIKSESELQSVRMVSYTGQVIFNRKATGNELLIYANEFAKGVYTLQIETKDGRSVHKVIIQ